MIRTGIYGQVGVHDAVFDNIMNVPEFNLVGLCNPQAAADDVSAGRVKHFSRIESLMDEVDAVLAFAPVSQLKNVELLVRNSKHVFFEPCLESMGREANKLSTIIEEANVKVQAGFHYRFNTTFTAAKPFIKKPKFIYATNFTNYSDDNRHRSVLTSLMIHDLDVVLSVIHCNIKNIQANVASIDGSLPDVLNVRIEFVNGSVAQLVAGRIAMAKNHEIKFFSDTNYVNINLLENKTWLVKKNNAVQTMSLFQKNIGDLTIEPIPIKQNNDLFEEFSAFAKSIVNDKPTEVDFETLMKTYDIIDVIRQKIALATMK